MNLEGKRVTLHDMSLRDGMHPQRHQLTAEQMIEVATALDANVDVGFHGHHNLHLGIANSLAAVEAGAARIDGSVAGMGAGAGNTPLEVFVAVLHRMGVETEIDMWKLMDVAEDMIEDVALDMKKAGAVEWSGE
ncbi:MAG: hypothetical protein JRD92_00760 [Deltaproteobacteria bacterium]|nr:hypothetical protein [Deltaproteobacteria bacterium]MBW2377669.1 hypothetical protein [Deltaproteobacteria bacterium]MBW2585458.1 hypothetical protein [Deltaproteobacteria bacterium]